MFHRTPAAAPPRVNGERGRPQRGRGTSPPSGPRYVMTPFAHRVQRGRMDNEQRGLDGVAEFDEFARRPAVAVERLDVFAQFQQDAPRPRQPAWRTDDAGVIPHRGPDLLQIL